MLRLYPSGHKKTVVERENNTLALEEAQLHGKLAEQAMLDEIDAVAHVGRIPTHGTTMGIKGHRGALGAEVDDRERQAPHSSALSR